MAKQLQHIGSRELVSFPEVGVFNVSAKVDTGADYSSVWASDIVEADGELSFALFAPGSRYYTGQRIRTHEYGLTFVRSSFGHSQERYRVKLLVEMGSKKVRVELTLADRSNNRYAMLIGKKTLRNRFVVDVTRDGILDAKEPLKILVMNSIDSSRVRGFFDKITEINPRLDCHFATYADVSFTVSGEALSCSILNHGTELSDYDLIYFKTYFKHAEIAAAMTEVATMQGVEFIDKEVATYHAKTKLTQYLRLARHGIAVPDSVVIPSGYLINMYDTIQEKLGSPFVMKDVASERGESNYLVQSKEDFERVRERAVKDKTLYVCQRYVDNDGDYRVFVLNKNVEFVVGRTISSNSTHITNISQGGTATRIPLDEFGAEPSAIAVRAATIMDRQVAGVDLVFDKNEKKWLVFEVNNSPQVTNGSFPEEKLKAMSQFLQQYAKK